MRQIASRPQLLTVAQAASLLSVSERTIRRWVADEKVPYARLPGGQIRIPDPPQCRGINQTHMPAYNGFEGSIGIMLHILPQQIHVFWRRHQPLLCNPRQMRNQTIKKC